MRIKLVVGLGNPGPKYENTLHNIGYRVIEALKKNPPKPSVPLEKSEGFMNSSGESVAKFVSRYRCDPSEVLIICDDIDLPRGQPRIRLKGSSGGHRGLDSVLQVFNRDDIPRLRLGVGRPPDQIDPADYVLKADELAEFEHTIERGAEAVRVVVEQGLEKAMNTFNQAAV
jgi:PTH1 family peptidyl-tRNA hydrolase